MDFTLKRSRAPRKEAPAASKDALYITKMEAAILLGITPNNSTAIHGPMAFMVASLSAASFEASRAPRSRSAAHRPTSSAPRAFFTWPPSLRRELRMTLEVALDPLREARHFL